MAHRVVADRWADARALMPGRRWGLYLSERQLGTAGERGDKVAWSYSALTVASFAGDDVSAGFCRRRAAGASPRLVQRRRPISNRCGLPCQVGISTSRTQPLHLGGP